MLQTLVRGGQKQKILDGPFKPKYGSISSTLATGCRLEVVVPKRGL